MSKVNITISQRPLTSLFLGILYLFLALLAIVDVLGILYTAYLLVSTLFTDNIISWKAVAIIVFSGVLLYIISSIGMMVQTVLKGMGEAEYLPVKRKLEDLLEKNEELKHKLEKLEEKNEELEKELSDARLDIRTLLQESQKS